MIFLGYFLIVYIGIIKNINKDMFIIKLIMSGGLKKALKHYWDTQNK